MSDHLDRTITVRPGGWSVVLFAGRFLQFTCGVLMLCVIGLWFPAISDSAQIGVLISISLVLVALVMGAVIRDVRRYELTASHASTRVGVVRKDAGTVLLKDIHAVNVHHSLAERMLGLETIVLSTAGGTIVWRHAAVVDALADQVRRRIDRLRAAVAQPPSYPAILPGTTPADGQRPHSIQPSHPMADKPDPTRRIPVIGLAGGIGAGKSAVAAALGAMGCMIIDSDARAKAALDRPEVCDELVRWWGGDILTNGRVDRSRVAAIIFADPEQRRKLEALVHPIVRQERAAMIKDAVQAGAKAVIVDAPLLFEAGVDKECDAAIFVDAPRELRLARVAASRGWTADELTRREQSQLPIEEKRARSRYIVDNSGSLTAVDTQVRRILEQILTIPPTGGGAARLGNDSGV